jgi:DNA-binding NtrC family response regulator
MPESKPMVFVVDDEPLIAATLERLLTGASFPVRVFRDAESAFVQVKKSPPFLALLDMQLPGMNGLEALALIKRHAPATEVMMISGYGTIGLAVEAMKLGAVDFLSKPLQLPEVLTRVNRLYETHQLRHKVDQLRGRRKEEFLGSLVYSQALGKIHRTVQRIGPQANLVVLITGESGTGKEMLARTIHHQSVHAEGAFVPVHCAAIPETLLESELFGYEPGAFTGALAEGKPGLFEKAADGTVFLDEIGDLAPTVQVKLLRFLQDRVVTRVGGDQGQAIECNIIAATHRDLEAMLRAGTFREDLYYRLNVIGLHLPPLRETPEDILTYATSFLERFGASMSKVFAGFDAAAQRKLMAHTWPGNLRELHNVIERACLLSAGPRITPSDLLIGTRESVADLGHGLVKLMALDHAMSLYARHVLDSVDGNKSKAARLLGITRNRLKRLLATS